MYIINKKTTSKVLYTVFTNLLFLYQKSHPFDARSLIRLQLVRKYRRLLHEVFCISFLHSKRTTIRRSRSQQCYKTLSYKNTTWRVWVACGILGPVDQPPQRACSDKTQRIRTETIASIRLPFDILLLLLDLLREGACYMEQFITWESAEYNPAFQPGS